MVTPLFFFIEIPGSRNKILVGLFVVNVNRWHLITLIWLWLVDRSVQLDSSRYEASSMGSSWRPMNGKLVNFYCGSRWWTEWYSICAYACSCHALWLMQARLSVSSFYWGTINLLMRRSVEPSLAVDQLLDLVGIVSDVNDLTSIKVYLALFLH